jgi:hypothetical protein
LVGFAIPVFAHPIDPLLISIQEIDELSGRIRAFRTLEHSESQILHVAGPSIGVGEEQIYAFVTAPEAIHVGTLRTLRPVLEQFAETNGARHGLVLQIRELIGTNQQKKIVRAQMRMWLLDKQGAAAARSFYEGSVLRSVLWGRLLSAASDTEMARRILDVRGQLSANISSDGRIVLDLTALSQQDRISFNTSELIAGILLEFEPRPTAAEEIDTASDYSQLNAGAHRRVEDLLSQISRTGRQEERIALLMSAILADPPIGKSALINYQHDRAKMADWGLKELRKAFIDTKWASDEQVIAALVPRLFTQQWPMTRGDLLFSLAKHLGKWPRVNQSIRDSLGKTRSVYVDGWRNEINEALGRPKAVPQATSRADHAS